MIYIRKIYSGYLNNIADNMSEVWATLRIGIPYLIIIGLTVIVQSLANGLMKITSDFFETKCFPLKITVIMVIVIYILVLAVLFNILIWTLFLMLWDILPYFWDAFTFATDSFTTLGNGGLLESPYEFLGPVIAVNGIIIVAFGVSCLYTILYKDSVPGF
jgi:hypothetical protein